MGADPITMASYDKFARDWAKYFSGHGHRTYLIELALKLADANEGKAKVVEIGCGDGYDAEAIIDRVAEYHGFDPSVGFLKLARERLPKADIKQADALSYEYPTGMDVIYAFAVLLHINRADLRKVLEKAHGSLRPGGILMLELKEGDTYTEKLKPSKFGDRMFYYYNATLIQELASGLFKTVYRARKTFDDTVWFAQALKKI